MSNAEHHESACYFNHGVSGYGVAAKLSREAVMEEDFIKKVAEELMLAIAQNCMDRGARAIGHIKSHIRTEAGTIKADTIGVGHGAFSKGHLDHGVNNLYMAINSIVAGIPEDSVREATLDGLHQVVATEHISLEKEREHTYFDEFDFMKSPDEFVRELEAQFTE